MVLSINIPLKASDEAIVKFLLGIVFAPRKQLNALSNRRECLLHDVFGATKLIEWILRKDKKNRKSLTTACNLVYGNTIVLSAQVARLLYDAIRAREVVAFTSYLAEEEERKRKTREQMEKGLEDDFTTPKKKRRSNAAERDDFLMTTPTLLSTALKQNITMPDVYSHHREDNIVIEDDLVPPTMEQLELLYGMLGSENRDTTVDLTFLDRLSSDDVRENVQNYDFEFQAATEDMIRRQHETPMKENTIRQPQDDPEEQQFEPDIHLRDVLLYGHLPLLQEGDQRRSLEDEMEDARHRGINHDDFVTPQRPEYETPQRMEIPRMDFQISLDSDIDIPVTPRTPRSARIQRSVDVHQDSINHKIPLREMHNMMEDFSSLHYSNTASLLAKKKPPGMSLKELMSPIPLCLRERCNKDLLELFNVKKQKYDKNATGNNVSMIEDEEEETRQNRHQNIDLDQLEPIELSQLKFKETPLKDQLPIMSPVRPNDIEMREEMEYPRRDDIEMREEMEYPRRDDFEPMNPIPISPRFEHNTVLEENNWNILDAALIEPNTGSNDRSTTIIREDILHECLEASPFDVELDRIIPSNSTSREAARGFYAVLELLKERQICAEQMTPYGSIKLRIGEYDSDDLDDMARDIESLDY